MRKQVEHFGRSALGAHKHHWGRAVWRKFAPLFIKRFHHYSGWASPRQDIKMLRTIKSSAWILQDDSEVSEEETTPEGRMTGGICKTSPV